jgi:hypothetical protein
VTVDTDGTYRWWTPERAAYFARFGQQAHVVALCVMFVRSDWCARRR